MVFFSESSDGGVVIFTCCVHEVEGSSSVVRLVYHIGDDNAVGGARVRSGEIDAEICDNEYLIEAMEVMVVWFQPDEIEVVSRDFECEGNLCRVRHDCVSRVRDGRMFVFPIGDSETGTCWR